MIERILLATDGSAFSAEAADHAIYLAEKCGALITAVHVISIRSPTPLTIENADKKGLATARTCLNKVITLGDENTPVETEILVSRTVPDALLEKADTGGYDIIIIGCRGVSGIRGMLLGSVSKAVVQKATCPVMVVR